MKAKKRGKRPGLRARSKNARKVVRVAAAPRIDMTEREELYRLRELAKAPPPPSGMPFVNVSEGAPPEGALVLVRLIDDSYLSGRVNQGFFQTFLEAQSEWIQFSHPERITHWMVIVPPVEPIEEQPNEGDDTRANVVLGADPAAVPREELL